MDYSTHAWEKFYPYTRFDYYVLTNLNKNNIIKVDEFLFHAYELNI